MPRSALLDSVAKRVGAPTGLRLRRTYAGRHQRAAGAWSWYAVDEQGREVLAGYIPLSELARCPGLTTSENRDNGLHVVLEVDPAYCQMCRCRVATRSYDPYRFELSPEDGYDALLCEECFQDRKDDV